MLLRERFNAAMKEAMKSGDKPRLSAVRLINSAVKDRDIEARGAGKGQATEDEIVTLLQKMIKQRQELAALYEKGARPELAAQERAEIAVISSFLPQQPARARSPPRSRRRSPPRAPRASRTWARSWRC